MDNWISIAKGPELAVVAGPRIRGKHGADQPRTGRGCGRERLGRAAADARNTRTVVDTLTAAGPRGNQLILEVSKSLFMDHALHITAQLASPTAQRPFCTPSSYGAPYWETRPRCVGQ